MRDMRHFIDVYTPPTDFDSRGQKDGSYTRIMQNVPAKIAYLSGREVETAHQLFPNATVKIEFYADASFTLNTSQKIIDTGTSKEFQIGHITDKQLNGLHITALCQEVF